MTQTIEQLTARVRELEADLVAARQIIDEENKDHIEQLAASQLSNQRLREALEKTRGALAYVKVNGRDNPNLMESTAWHGLALADKALSQPTSTEALDAYVAEKVKEARRTAEYWKENHLAGNEQIATLTRQRDLAVEALEITVNSWSEQFERHGHLAPEWAVKCRNALSTIKESENNKAS